MRQSTRTSVTTLLLSALFPLTLIAQSFYGDITLKSQSDIDNFPINYPFSEFDEGTILIADDNDGVDPITNLLGLAALTEATGNLVIQNNGALINLDGLESLYVAGDLVISGNPALTEIDALDALLFISRLEISNNDSLETISDLNLVESVYAEVTIEGNEALRNISGFNSLSLIEGIRLQNNPALFELGGFQSLTHVDGPLVILDNPSLSNLDGFGSLNSILVHLWIRGNHSLKDLDGLHSLNSVGGWVNIDSNDALTNLDGLRSLTSVGEELFAVGDDNVYVDVRSNPSLRSFCGLHPLLSSETWISLPAPEPPFGSRLLIVSGNLINPTVQEILDEGPCVPNMAPIAQCQNVTIEAGPGGWATGSVDAGSYDPDGDAIAITQLPVGPYPLGVTSVTLCVTDSRGAASTCAATVTVVDSTPPSITLIGNNPQIIECGAPYTELGANASDLANGDLSLSIVVDASAIRTTTLGTYPVTYNVADNSGNAAAEVTRLVTIVDTTGPSIEAADIVVAPTSPGGAEVAFNFTATDGCDPNPSTTYDPASGSLFPFGTTLVTGIAADASGNQSTVSFTVTVKTPQTMSQELIDTIATYDLNRGLESSLTWKIRQAMRALDRGRTVSARVLIQVVILQARSREGRGLSPDESDEIVSVMETVLASIPRRFSGRHSEDERVILIEYVESTDEVEVIWSSGTLESSSSVASGWSPVPGAQPPFHALPLAETRYFRIAPENELDHDSESK